MFLHSECAPAEEPSLKMTQRTAWWISGMYWVQETTLPWRMNEFITIRLQRALQRHFFRLFSETMNSINMERKTTNSKGKASDSKNKNLKTDRNKGDKL